jgi:hypothetical protein
MIIEIFYDVDNFCQKFINKLNKNLLPNLEIKKQNSRMVISEIMTIIIFYHLSGYKCFKYFYLHNILKNYKSYFPKIVSYNRFIELMPKVTVPLLYFLKYTRMSECTGISYIDSTKIAVCNNKRIKSNKVFKKIAKRGKTSMGFFYGFKLHLIVSHKGDLLSFSITKGNKSDRNKSLVSKMCEDLFGKLFGDKGYISNKLRNDLKKNKNIQLITKLNSNMKNKLINLPDKILLNKRGVIETINDQLKNICNIEHTRHRSVFNFFVNLISGLIAYTFLPNKPSIRLSVAETNLLLDYN